MNNKFKKGDVLKHIATGNWYLTTGATYVVEQSDSKGVWITDDDGDTDQYYPNEDFEFLSKSGTYHNGKFYEVVKTFEVSEELKDHMAPAIKKLCGKGVTKFHQLKGKGIVLASECVDNFEVVLSSEYTAKIEKGLVTVGCQRIDIEKVREILKIHDENFKD